jgi:hypothetical protein
MVERLIMEGTRARGVLLRAVQIGKVELPADYSTSDAGTAAAATSLSTRLHGLEAVFSPLASNLAHPRELEDQQQFAEAVRLLEDPGVPLDTVMQYALGANWPLACAALAALKKRADRSERADEDVAHFEKLYPWPIYFALAYLLAVEPRAPVGERAGPNNRRLRRAARADRRGAPRCSPCQRRASGSG